MLKIQPGGPQTWSLWSTLASYSVISSGSHRICWGDYAAMVQGSTNASSSGNPWNWAVHICSRYTLDLRGWGRGRCRGLGRRDRGLSASFLPLGSWSHLAGLQGFFDKSLRVQLFPWEPEKLYFYHFGRSETDFEHFVCSGDYSWLWWSSGMKCYTIILRFKGCKRYLPGALKAKETYKYPPILQVAMKSRWYFQK